MRVVKLFHCFFLEGSKIKQIKKGTNWRTPEYDWTLEEDRKAIKVLLRINYALSNVILNAMRLR